MGIDARLELEGGEVLGEVADPRNVLSRSTACAFTQTILLKYLVPWGDAMFNHAQADELLADIAMVKRLNPDTPLSDLLSELDPLVSKLSTEPHAYLWFRGD